MTDTILDGGEIYAETRQRIIELVGARPDSVERVVPATPDWRVRDLLSHLAGNCACILEGRMGGVGTDPWTAAQVQERRSHAIDEILAEWESTAPQVEAMIPTWPAAAASRLVADLATHEQDLRGALEVPGARDSRAFAIAFDGFCSMLADRLTDACLPPLRVKTAEGEQIVGGGKPGATVAADRFELTRAMAGRRSARQVAAFTWDGDPQPYIAVFTPFALRADDLIE